MSFRCCLPLLCIGLLVCRPALADGLTESMFLSGQPVVLTASRIQQSPLDAPAPVTVIDRQTIRASGFTEIQDLLRLVPGFEVADYYGGSPVVTNHGMGSAFPHNLLVLLNGQSIVDPITGGVDWMDLPIRVDDIQRIEVVRGPDQASYGAGAYNGVINIITRAPAEDAGTTVVFSAGRHGFREEYARLARQGKSTDWRISASDRYLETFRDDGTPDSAYRRNDARQTFDATLVHRLGLDQELSANIGLSWGQDEVGGSLDDTYPYHNHGIQNQYLQLAWHAAGGSGSEMWLRYYHYAHRQTEDFVISVPSLDATVPMNLDAKTGRDELEFQQNGDIADGLKGLWGVDLIRDHVRSQRYFYGKGTLYDSSWQTYGNLDWRWTPKWLVHVGAMLENHGNTGTLFSPRLAVNYSLSRTRSLRFSMGRGYRAPTLLESDALEAYLLGGVPVRLGVISPLPIDPEAVDFAELGYTGRYERLGLKVDGRVYTEHYSRYINNYDCSMNGVVPGYEFAYACQVTPPPDYAAVLPPYLAFQYQNAGDIRVNGGELALDWRHAQWGRFLMSYALSNIRASGIPDPMTQADIEVSAPAYTFSLLWSRSFAYGLDGSVGFYHVAYMKWLGDGDDQPAYNRVDLRLAKHIGPPDSKDEIALTLQNLNDRHQEFRPNSTPLRQAFVTLRLGW